MMNMLFPVKKLITLESVDSTNSYASNLLKNENIPEGTVIVAREQRSGKGQRGNLWESEAGKNLTFSVIFYPSFLLADEHFIINKAVCLAVCDFVRKTIPGKNVKIKWPNDIYICNDEKKECDHGKKAGGILIENTFASGKIMHTIIGIGLNINQTLFGSMLANVTSLRLEKEQNYDLNQCLSSLCNDIERRYLQIKTNNKNINSNYEKNLYRFFQYCPFITGGEKIIAKITGTDKNGRIELEKKDGIKICCNMKEISFQDY